MRQLIDMPGFGRQKHFILSGLLRSQAREINSRLRQLSAEVEKQWEHDGVWFTLYGHNRPSTG
jgi:ribosomal protein L11 methyltransferase